MPNEKYDVDSIIPELLARLEVQEMLLTRLYANWVAGSGSEEFEENLADEIRRTADNMRGPPTGDPDEIEFLVERQRHMRSILESFATKALKLGRAIRDAKAPAANDEG
ncbi:MAG: hypothetical protein KIS73_05165 [Enhydrobacter sp.]|nr:hypothetical protein [Enhydrobacter sp.]